MCRFISRWGEVSSLWRTLNRLNRCAPRSTKMGTTLSPCLYDAAVRRTPKLVNLRQPYTAPPAVAQELGVRLSKMPLITAWRWPKSSILLTSSSSGRTASCVKSSSKNPVRSSCVSTTFDALADESDGLLENRVPSLVPLLPKGIPKKLKIQTSTVARSVNPRVG